jgi:plastocyanin
MRLSKINQSTAAKFPGNIFIGFLVVLCLALASGSAGQYFTATAQEQSDTKSIHIDNFSFGPMDLTVPVGTRVTWINRDDVPHTVVSIDQRFKSQALDTGEEFSITFEKPGSYEYFCSVHPKMTGKIVVK